MKKPAAICITAGDPPAGSSNLLKLPGAFSGNLSPKLPLACGGGIYWMMYTISWHFSFTPSAPIATTS